MSELLKMSDFSRARNQDRSSKIELVPVLVAATSKDPHTSTSAETTEYQDSQSVCQNGTCVLTWKPRRPSTAA